MKRINVSPHNGGETNNCLSLSFWFWHHMLKYFYLGKALFLWRTHACVRVCLSLYWETDGASAEMCSSWIMVKAYSPYWGHRWILTCNTDNAWNKHLRSNALCILWQGWSSELYAVATLVCISYARPLSSKTNVILPRQTVSSKSPLKSWKKAPEV